MQKICTILNLSHNIIVKAHGRASQQTSRAFNLIKTTFNLP